MRVSAFAKHFGLMQEVRQVPDPWEVGITFFIASSRNPEFQKWQEEQRLKNPALSKIANAQLMTQVRGDADDWTLPPLTEEEMRALFGDKRGVADGAAILLKNWDGLTTVDTETGEVAPCSYSKEEAMKLLTDEEVFIEPVMEPDTDDDGHQKLDKHGKPKKRVKKYTGGFLGRLLQEFVIDCGNEYSKYKEQLEEEHAKNSETSSGGD